MLWLPVPSQKTSLPGLGTVKLRMPSVPGLGTVKLGSKTYSSKETTLAVAIFELELYLSLSKKYQQKLLICK